MGFWRGGQFLLFFPRREAPAGARVMQEILRLFRERRFDTGDLVLASSFSAGLTGCEEDWSFERCVDESERILYLAKAAGRACVLSEPGDGPARRPGHRKVLLVEGDPTMVVLVKHRLEREQFTVHHCSTGRAALEAAYADDYDLELLAHLRQEKSYEKVPFVVLTSLGEESNVVRAFELGADDYVTKPFSTHELAARIHRLLQKRG